MVMLRNRQRGVVLITTLMLVIFMSSLFVLMSKDTLVNQKRIFYRTIENQSIDTILGLESTYLYYIKNNSDMSFNQTFFNNLSNSRINKYLIDMFPDASIDISLKDNTNCLNINSVVSISRNDEEIEYIKNDTNVSYIYNYLNLNNIDPIIISEFLDQVLDWIDTDDEPRSYGIEDYFYTGPLSINKQYTGKRLFFNKNELLTLPALSQFDINKLNHICVHPYSTKQLININSLVLDDYILVQSLYPDFSADEAKLFIKEIPLSRIRNKSELSRIYNDYNLDNLDLFIYKTGFFQIKTKVRYRDFDFSVTSFINDLNSNSKISHRHYNND